VTPLLAASANEDVAVTFIEIGAVALALALLARLAGRLGITAIPLYLLAGLLVGEGGFAPLDISADFISIVAEIGVLLLLLALGLEYGADELKQGLRTSAVPGVVDAALGFTPGFVVALVLGWSTAAAVLLGGVTWVSSSGIIAKVLQDLDRLGNRETPTILNLLVVEDLAMAVFLPLAAALATGQDAPATLSTIAVALVVVTVILVVAMRFGGRLSAALEPANDESLLLAVFGLTLLVGGLAQALDVSAAIGAFLVGLALSGTVQHRAATLIGPMRDLFAAVFFLFFSFQIHPGDLVDAAVPGLVLAVFGIAGKLLTGSVAAGRAGVGPAGRRRAGATLVARGEFSIVVAALGASLVDGPDLGAVAATFVLVTAVVGPLLARFAR
jgi:CPA2 family monovalent cation:H+ antiporter-2